MSIFSFVGGSVPRRPYQLERDLEDALESANAGWDQEHDIQGHHTDLTADSLAARDGATPVVVRDGLHLYDGPFLMGEPYNEFNTSRAVVRAGVIVGNQDNYRPPHIDTAIVLELESTSAITISGLWREAFAYRRFLWIVNRGNHTLTFSHNSSSSSSVNRFAFSGDQNYALLSGGVLFLYYDPGAPIWRGEGNASLVLSALTYQYLTGAGTFVDRIGTISCTIDGGGSVITTGIKCDFTIDTTCTIQQVTMLADVSGSIVVDIWKDTYGNFPPTVADTITASAKPTITSATKSQDATLTGWTTALAAGSTLRFNVDSCTSITRLQLDLKVRIG